MFSPVPFDDPFHLQVTRSWPHIHSCTSLNLRCLLHLASQNPKTALLGGVLKWGHRGSLVELRRKEREGSPETNAEGACWHSVQDSVQKGVRVPRCKQETGREMLLKKRSANTAKKMTNLCILYKPPISYSHSRNRLYPITG